MNASAGKGGDVEHIVGPYYSDLPGLPFGMANIANLGNTGGISNLVTEEKHPMDAMAVCSV